jgi:sugar O-acyltransferase (sialic acid O-acetyltransferase NeuD family)
MNKVQTPGEKVIVFGNSKYAEHIYFLLTYDSPHEIVGFTVDQKYIVEESMFDLPVVPFESIENRYPPDQYRIFISASFQRVNRLRAQKYRQAKEKGYRFVNFTSSSVTSYPGLQVGENCAIMENVVIGPFAQIGNNVVIASGSIIGHHAVIADHVFISNSVVVLGGVSIGEYTLVGANATIKEEVKVHRECIIGAGVSITKHTQEKGVYVNPPVKLFPKRSDELQTWMMWPLRLRKN